MRWREKLLARLEEEKERKLKKKKKLICNSRMKLFVYCLLKTVCFKILW